VSGMSCVLCEGDRMTQFWTSFPKI